MAEGFISGGVDSTMSLDKKFANLGCSPRVYILKS